MPPQGLTWCQGFGRCRALGSEWDGIGTRSVRGGRLGPGHSRTLTQFLWWGCEHHYNTSQL